MKAHIVLKFKMAQDLENFLTSNLAGPLVK